MKYYELTYLISPDLSEEEIRTLQEKINALIQAEGGVLSEVNSPVRKTLAYPVKKKWTTYLNTLSFQLDPERLESLKKKLKAESEILRYLILTKPRTKEILVRGKKLPPIRPRKRVIKPKVELKEIEKKLEEILGE